MQHSWLHPFKSGDTILERLQNTNAQRPVEGIEIDRYGNAEKLQQRQKKNIKSTTKLSHIYELAVRLNDTIKTKVTTMYLHKHISANNVSIDNFPFQREIAMEAYLIENPTVLSMETDGFNEVEIIESEVALLDGRTDKNTDGRIDILAKYGQEYLAVVELKLGQLTETHLKQLESYLKERQQILKKFPDVWDTTISQQPKWIGVMIGATINPDLMLKIRKGYYYDTNIPIAALTINRYKGKDGNVYVVTDTYFIEKVTGRDYTKYIFKGQKYGKNRLVLAVIKDYVEKNPTITYSQLKAKFPDILQGQETFTTETDAKQKRDRRNFIEPSELITLTDETIAVSTQWGLENINPFIDHCKKMSIDINKTQ